MRVLVSVRLLRWSALGSIPWCRDALALDQSGGHAGCDDTFEEVAKNEPNELSGKLRPSATVMTVQVLAFR
ncbi:MAG: hypothetical protein ACLQFM_15585 [Terriglobales bacterium]|jgi:hypothetical protein